MTVRTEPGQSEGVASTGVTGLDEILPGGLPRNRVYLIEGDPGAGKTTMGLQFLLQGKAEGERGLYLTLSESEGELQAISASHGWSLDGIEVSDLEAATEPLTPNSEYTVFHPDEVELGELTKAILDAHERTRPQRIVIDSLSEMRLLAQDPLRFRRQIHTLKRHLTESGVTVLLLDYAVQQSSNRGAYPIETVAHGVIQLRHSAPAYGGSRRRLRILKLRGSPFAGGHHDLEIRTGGLEVYPRLVAADFPDRTRTEELASGLEGLDRLLGGGLCAGTTTLFVGATGAGKSSLAAQYVRAAHQNGHRSVVYTFEESPSSWTERGQRLGLETSRLAKEGRLVMRKMDPAQNSPGEFAADVRRRVEEDDVRLVVLDSLSGYINAMPEEQFLPLHVHELVTYLGQRNVWTILILPEYGLIGENVGSSADVSYLADSVVVLRYFESSGSLRQAISCLKKRDGDHERAIRELRFSEGHIEVGERLDAFQGVLTGHLEYLGDKRQLFDRHADG